MGSLGRTGRKGQKYHSQAMKSQEDPDKHHAAAVLSTLLPRTPSSCSPVARPPSLPHQHMKYLLITSLTAPPPWYCPMPRLSMTQEKYYTPLVVWWVVASHTVTQLWSWLHPGLFTRWGWGQGLTNLTGDLSTILTRNRQYRPSQYTTLLSPCTVLGLCQAVTTLHT